ncbi:MAG: hypothetical protein FE78DRAFT_30864 [Acidomyces sp. 'richmondensis']|nr:MAG: hypothetical protein FE78DRAFT_30864 [Acidomyces sp. 'richmondensis']
MSISFLAPSAGMSALERSTTNPDHAHTFVNPYHHSQHESVHGVRPSVRTQHSSFAVQIPRTTVASRQHTNAISGCCKHPRRHSVISITSSGDSGEDRPGNRRPRPPRPSYSEEQKFYIMYARIIRGKSWPEIEGDFVEIFGSGAVHRSKGGLTSVYYRIRRSWGLEEVLQTSQDALAGDKLAVNLRASNFSVEFLASIGYLD